MLCMGRGSVLQCSLHHPLCRLQHSQDTRVAFSILGLEETATKKEIKTAYIRLSKLHHPDHNPGSTIAAKRYLAIREAYDTLSALPERDTSQQPPDTGWKNKSYGQEDTVRQHGQYGEDTSWQQSKYYRDNGWQNRKYGWEEPAQQRNSNGWQNRKYGWEEPAQQRNSNRTWNEDWLKELERANRMRKQREKRRREQGPPPPPPPPPHQNFNPYNPRQREAMSNFEKKFVRRIDSILENKAWRWSDAGSTWQERLRSRTMNFNTWIFLIILKFLLSRGGPFFLLILIVLLCLDSSQSNPYDEIVVHQNSRGSKNS